MNTNLFFGRWSGTSTPANLLTAVLLGGFGIAGAYAADKCCVRTDIIKCSLAVDIPCQPCSPCGTKHTRLDVPECVPSEVGYKYCTPPTKYDCREKVDCEPGSEDFAHCGSINDIIQRKCVVSAPVGVVVQSFVTAADTTVICPPL